MFWILKIIYFVCPFLAIGSLGWYIFGNVGIWAALLFPVLGYAGMLAQGAAVKLEENKRNSFTFRAGDPVSIARAAFFEIEAKNEIPGLSYIKKDILLQLDDKKRAARSILEDKIDPRGLIYLLISNITNAKLCTGQYHFYRGKLTSKGYQLFRAFAMASQQMVNLGIQDQVEHENDMESLKKELSEIG